MMPVVTFSDGKAVAIVFSVEQARDVFLNSIATPLCVNIPECRFCRSMSDAEVFFGRIKGSFGAIYEAARLEIPDGLASEIVSRNAVDDKMEHLYRSSYETAGSRSDTELVRRIVATYLALKRIQP